MAPLSCWVVTLLSCQTMQAQGHSHRSCGEACDGHRGPRAAAEDSSGLAETEECKQQSCMDNSLHSKGSAALAAVFFSLNPLLFVLPSMQHREHPENVCTFMLCGSRCVSSSCARHKTAALLLFPASGEQDRMETCLSGKVLPQINCAGRAAPRELSCAGTSHLYVSMLNRNMLTNPGILIRGKIR